jgi:hypothetical protein
MSKEKCLHAILTRLWVPVWVAKLDETCYLVQIYIIFPFEAQMVELSRLNIVFVM